MGKLNYPLFIVRQDHSVLTYNIVAVQSAN